METLFRKLRADEIDIRVQSVNKGGAVLLCYKDARVDQNLLDEVFTPFGWQRKHELIGDNLYCTISVKDPATGEWISKQDVGVESYTEKEKGQASDSFKRACFNLGIGRELYSAPNLFFPKDELFSYSEENGKCKCNDKFRVTKITHSEDGNIASMTIECSYYGKKKERTFTNAAAPSVAPAKTTTTSTVKAVKNTTITPTVEKEAPKAPEKEVKPEETKEAPTTALFADNEKILIGNCRGKTYGEAKGTSTFISFLEWVKTATSKYDAPAVQDQFTRFKKLAELEGIGA